jgi:acyl-coenzyme A synthetase/AMP-(fatty) acid ligase
MNGSSTVDEAAAEIGFATSGSTGAPVSWLRTAAQVRAEVEILATRCVPDGTDGIVCYAPPRHLYGYLMGQALPHLLDLPVTHLGPTDSPAEALRGLRRPLLAALPAALAALTRCLPALRELDRVVLVHSSALLPPAGRRLATALGDRSRFIELFGSTETGLVATRTGLDRPEWILAPDVRFGSASRTGTESLLCVRSPRIAHHPDLPPAAEHQLDDVVTVLSGTTFRWLGRRSRLVKVNGQRVNLDDVLSALNDRVPGAELTCVPERDPVRGEWFSLRVADPADLDRVTAACHGLPAPYRPRTVQPDADRLTGLRDDPA